MRRPGGKTYDMAHAMQGKGQIVAVDLPGKRIARLEENLSTLRSEDLKCEIVECDLLEMDSSTLEDKRLLARMTLSCSMHLVQILA